jgi:putative inorganic carbon (HCO3(-)) transporter
MVLLDFVSSKDLPRRKWALPRGVRWFVLYLTPVIIFLTLTRGNWLGFVLGIWVFLFMGRRLIEHQQKLRAVALIMILLPIGIIGVQEFLSPESLPKEISSRASDAGNVNQRFKTWKIAIDVGLQSPIFGIGLNNMRDILGKLGHKQGLTTVHNCFLAFFLELGVVGLLTYLAIIASIIRTGLNLYRKGTHSQDRWRGVGIIAIMAAYLTPALTETILYTETIHIYVFACIGGIAGMYSPKRFNPGLARDILVPVMYSKELNSTTSSVPFQRTALDSKRP